MAVRVMIDDVGDGYGFADHPGHVSEPAAHTLQESHSLILG